MHPNERQFWKSRATARNTVVVIAIGFSIVQQTENASGKLVIPVFGAFTTIFPQIELILALVCLFAMNSRRVGFINIEHERQMKIFSIFTACVAIIESCKFLYLAQISDLSTVVTASDRVVIQSIENGSIPMNLMFGLILPLITTPCGMDANLAKLVSVVTFVSLIFSILAMRHRMVANCIAESCTEEQLGDRYTTMRNDFLAVLAMVSLAYSTCVPGSVISNEFVELLRAGRTADSFLNHLLKNTIAGAACLIEIDQHDASSAAAVRICGCGTRSSMGMQQALNQLYTAMRWCSSRQVMVDLAGGRYISAISAVDISSFQKRFARGRANFVFSDEIASGAAREELEILFDEKIAVLALENAVTNALEHGTEGADIKIGTSFRGDLTSGIGTGRVILTVTNQVPAGLGLTNEHLQRIVDGSSKAAAADGVVDALMVDQAIVKQTKSSHSTNSGLRHINLAVKGVRGASFELGLAKDGQSVILAISLPAQLLVKPITASRTTHAAKEPYIFGSSSFGSEGLGLSAAGSFDSPAPDVTMANLNFAAIDDSKLICKGYSRMLYPQLGANMEESSVVCPRTHIDVARFMASVKVHAPLLKGEKVSPSSRGTDVVLLDQNIDLQGEEALVTVYGTDLATELRARRFEGLIIIRSANSSKEDRESYMLGGAVDGCLGKAESHKSTARLIREAYEQKKRKRAEPEEPDVSFPGEGDSKKPRLTGFGVPCAT